jgi:hypothetical protein
MRRFRLDTLLAFGLAATFAAIAPAKAEMGGPMVDEKGMCRQFNGNNQNGMYYHMEKCAVPTAHAEVSAGNALPRSTPSATVIPAKRHHHHQ